MPIWIQWVGWAIEYLPTFLRLIPSLIIAVKEIEDAFRGKGTNMPTSDVILKARKRELRKAILESRRGNHAPLAAIYKFYTRKPRTP